MIDPETFARYAAMRVPRYTSYPTAPNFTSAIGEAECWQWLAELEPASEISLYLHVPFCRAMCWYCGCHTSVTRRPEPVKRYAEALRSEMAMIAGALRGRMTVRHLHWGGGSPTLLRADDLEMLDAGLRAGFDFAPGAELAVEIDPRTLDEDFARSLGRSGINRASIGVQSFDPKVQSAINRTQTVEQTATAVGLLRGNGVEGINFDLIYGLPHQTVGSCLETIESALAMRPDRFAVFGYAHVPSFKAHQRKIDEAALPGPEERGRQAETMAQALVAAGYRQIGLDHFALPGDSLALAADSGALHRNFQGYTTDPCRILIGLGASAISKLPRGFLQNSTNIPEYERRVAGGELPIARGCRVTEEDARRAAIIERLMCEYRADIGTTVPSGLDRVASDGLVRRRGSLVEVTECARPLVRVVAAAFDEYLEAEGLHSRAL